MSTTSDTDLKELKDLINKRFDSIETRFESIEERMKELEIGQAKIETRLDEWKNSIAKIPDLAKKVGELKNWKQITIVTFSALFAGTMGWLLRGAKF